MKKADIPELHTLRPEPKRDPDGHYLLPHPETGTVVGWERATTLAGLHEDHKQIELWQKRTVLEGVLYEPEILEQLPALVEAADGGDWRSKKAIDRLAATAHDAAGGNDGSKWGTLLHTMTEWADAGRMDEVMPTIETWGETGTELLAKVDQYQKTMAENGLECPPEYIERIVVNLTCRSGGTLDRMVRLPDGRLWIGDLKTQKSMGYGAVLKIAAQLAEYAFADGLLAPDGRSIASMPEELDQLHALIMWLPVMGPQAGKCQLIELGPQEMEYGWSLAQHAAQTLWFRSIAESVRGRTYDPSLVITPAALLSEISHAESPEHVRSIWKRYPRAVRDRVWTDAHTAGAQSRIAELAKIGIK